MKRHFRAILTTLTMVGLYVYADSFHRYNRSIKYDFVMFLTICFLLVNLIFFVLDIIYLFKESRYKKIGNYTTLTIPTIGFLFMMSPLFRAKELVPLKFHICYEGTQNSSRGYFRTDNSFEINATGVFGYNKWYTGNWKMSNDTLFLYYDNEKHNLLSDSNVIDTKSNIYPIRRDSINKINGFYLGYCRGEN